MNWQDYIISDNQILLGKPTIKGTRVSVELVLELFAAGWTEKQILESYPTVSAEALRAVLKFGAIGALLWGSCHWYCRTLNAKNKKIKSCR